MATMIPSLSRLPPPSAAFPPSRFPRSPLRPAALLGLLALFALRGTATAQPPHAWGYPLCGPQLPISGVYDHEHPTYGCPPNGQGEPPQACGGHNGRIRLYNDTVDNARAYEGHDGWDYATRAADGMNLKRRVFAVDEGTVVQAGWHYPGDPEALHCWDQVRDHHAGYGLMLRIDHGDRLSLYGHLSAIHVEIGDRVARGQIIGATGDTGNSGGPHLHFGVELPRPATPAPPGPATPDPAAPTPHDRFRSADPYGWNADWSGLLDLPLPRERDPWFGASGIESRRLILPGAPDAPPCPEACAGPPLIVDDADPGFAIDCQNPPCLGWHRAARGYAGQVHYGYPQGLRVDHRAIWTAPLPPGIYEVEAFIPAALGIGTVHAARYRLAGREVIVDQSGEGGIWVGLGIHRFAAAPRVELLDASYIRDNWVYRDTCQTIAADALRFTPACAIPGDPGAPPPSPTSGAPLPPAPGGGG